DDAGREGARTRHRRGVGGRVGSRSVRHGGKTSGIWEKMRWAMPALQGGFPEMQVGLLEVPELPPGDELAETGRRGDLGAFEVAVDEVAVDRGELLLHGV